jgi:hypothetical protein
MYERHDYLIRVGAHLGEKGASPFEHHQVRALADGDRVIRAAGLYQAALFGLLIRIRDLGMPLISVRQEDGRAVEDQ